jgi:hypothetical protein
MTTPSVAELPDGKSVLQNFSREAGADLLLLAARKLHENSESSAETLQESARLS